VTICTHEFVLRGHAAFEYLHQLTQKLHIWIQWNEKCGQHNLKLAHKQTQHDRATRLYQYSQSESEQTKLVKRKSNHAHF